MNVKFLFNQKKIDLFIAENAFKITNHKELVDQDLEDLALAEMIEVQGLVEDLETTEKEKCLPQNVGTVEMNVKFLSNQKKIDLFIAENVFKIINKTNHLFKIYLKTPFFPILF